MGNISPKEKKQNKTGSYINAAGRTIPNYIEGYGYTRKYTGAFTTPKRPGTGIPVHLNPINKQSKVVESLEVALKNAGFCSGMTISFHHHFRNGDVIGIQIAKIAEKMGLKDITFAPTSFFPVHKSLLEFADKGIIKQFQGSTNGDIGSYHTKGKGRNPAVLRSHGGRARALAEGDLIIDIAVSAISTCDNQGNGTGRIGPTPLGPIGYIINEVTKAKHNILVTNNLVDFPCSYRSVSGSNIDQIVVDDVIGDPKGIMTGTTSVDQTKEPHRSIAAYASKVPIVLGLVKNGFRFQAGAGGMSLLATKFVADYCKENQIVAAFGNGGSTDILLDMLKNGTCQKMVDIQSFTDKAAVSMNDFPSRHIEYDIDEYANIYNSMNTVNLLDFLFIGATEVDVDFNVNVNTHSDGSLLHGIGGHQDAGSGSFCTVVTCPTARKTFPIILDQVTTISTPGECIDVLVTEEGIVINPRREDLLERISKIPPEELPWKVLTMAEMRTIAIKKSGRATIPRKNKDRIVAVIEWRDGTVLDVVKEVIPEAKKEDNKEEKK